MLVGLVFIQFASCSKTTYKIGDVGPAGGYIFYDCDADNKSGNYDGLISTECGWQYLEVAPEDLGSFPFGYYRVNGSSSRYEVGTDTEIGTGEKNTENLVFCMGEMTSIYEERKRKDEKGLYAAKMCFDYSTNVDGVIYNDWFLPSQRELNLVYTNLYKKGLGTFASAAYWTSSELDNSESMYQGFDDGSQWSDNRSSNLLVLPIRAFSVCRNSVSHSWNSGDVTKKATCFEIGEITFTCTVCGQKKTEVIMPSNSSHSWDSGIEIKQATCTSDGERIYTCLDCGYEKTEVVYSLDHSYVDYRCSVCGIWDKGPSGGYVFYDCDADNDFGNADGLTSAECGWRYLEAAPSDLEGKYQFGYYRTSDNGKALEVGTSEKIGSGKANTEALVKAMGEMAYKDTSGKSKGEYAAKVCDDYSITVDGTVYDDWFLPSMDELKFMYVNLYKQGMGSFPNYGDYYYWSSTESSNINAWTQFFLTGKQPFYARYNDCRVRPIRAFK